MARIKKHRWRVQAIEAMQPGQAILFKGIKPWGLASIIYKKGLREELGLTLTINETLGELLVTRAAIPVIWE